MNTVVQMQTSRGYARFILVKTDLLVIFYLGGMPVTSYQFVVTDPVALFNGAWNMGLLAWVILNYEPIFKPT